MKYDARCNQRACQARRPLPGAYDPNDRVPCHMPSCKGLMYEDKNRKTKARKARDVTGGLGRCHCDGVAWADMRNSPHIKGAQGCRHREGVLLERSLKPPPKHSPRKKPYEPEGDPPF